ncbi:MAG: hypothetical protein ACK4N4_03530 [Burkholderiales bacterium]
MAIMINEGGAAVFDVDQEKVRFGRRADSRWFEEARRLLPEARFEGVLIYVNEAVVPQP